MTNKVSHVDQAVITRALLAGAHEMGAKLIRSAHSPIVREAQDCSAALLDRRGNVVAQSELIALQLGSITHTFRPCLELYDLDEIKPDDFLSTTTPFTAVSTCRISSFSRRSSLRTNSSGSARRWCITSISGAGRRV